MPFYTNPVFAALFLSSPVWLFIIGTVLRVKFQGSASYVGRLGITLQYLAEITLCLDLLLATDANIWPAFFTGLLALLFWSNIIGTCVIGIVSFTDTKKGELGLPTLWSISIVIGLAMFIAYCLVQVFFFFVGIFNQITIKG